MYARPPQAPSAAAALSLSRALCLEPAASAHTVPLPHGWRAWPRRDRGHLSSWQGSDSRSLQAPKIESYFRLQLPRGGPVP